VIPQTLGPDPVPGDSTFLDFFPDGTQLGLFFVGNGGDIISGLPGEFLGGEAEFRGDDGTTANVFDLTPPEVILRSVVEEPEDGISVVETVVDNPVFFTFDPTPELPLTNELNDGGFNQAISGASPDNSDAVRIGFEDLVLDQSDVDFNDLLVDMTFTNIAPPDGDVTVFTSDFNAGAPSEFSGVSTTEDVQGYAGLGTGPNVFDGEFLRNTSEGDPASATTLTLDGLPAHNSIDLNFLLAIIDSWDGESGSGFPDIFNVTVDGELIFAESFTNISSAHVASYPSPTTPTGVVLAREEQLGFTGGDIFSDSAYNMGLEPAFENIPHTSSTLTVEWFASGAGWQAGDDESWAIDNVEVIVERDPVGEATATSTLRGRAGDGLLSGTDEDGDFTPADFTVQLDGIDDSIDDGMITVA
jgi:hypothetical protein